MTDEAEKLAREMGLMCHDDACSCHRSESSDRHLAAIRAFEERVRRDALTLLVATLPKCQACNKPATREDCNCLYGCDDDEHVCHGDGGTEDLPWAAHVRALADQPPEE